mmetsp:Transcript_49125/g.141225  ORF Transcript_49125/g.141225 Transcript_49125/m.141225 type:complete len:293 (+) Transcript_49125:348-1226(+)
MMPSQQPTPPTSAAALSAVFPSRFRVRTSAPAASSASTASSMPPLAAMISAVSPARSLESGGAPALRSLSTTLLCPAAAAAINGVRPVSLCGCDASAMTSSSAATSAARPRSASTKSGVRPNTSSQRAKRGPCCASRRRRSATKPQAHASCSMAARATAGSPARLPETYCRASPLLRTASKATSRSFRSLSDTCCNQSPCCRTDRSTKSRLSSNSSKTRLRSPSTNAQTELVKLPQLRKHIAMGPSNHERKPLTDTSRQPPAGPTNRSVAPRALSATSDERRSRPLALKSAA